MTTLSEWASGQHPAAPGTTTRICNCTPAMAKDGGVQHAADCPVESTAPLPAIDWQKRALDAERGWHDALLNQEAHLVQGRLVQRGTNDLLVSMGHFLEEILAVLKHLDSTAREGAATRSVSSVEVKFLAPTKDYPQGRAQPVVKVCAGSEAPVEEAIIAYAKTVALAEHAQMEGWAQTVAAVTGQKAETRAERLSREILSGGPLSPDNPAKEADNAVP